MHPKSFVSNFWGAVHLRPSFFISMDSQERMFMHTRDWPFSPVSESEILKWYGRSRWRIEL